jgi:glyoxylate utilization-related uncharacterized protein
MKLIKASETTHYEAKDHFNCWTGHKLTTGEGGSQKIDISYSHFLPNGGANYTSSSAERVYILMEGSLLVKGENEEHSLEPGDIIYIASGEKRSVQVKNNKPATILVIIVK